MNPFANDKMVSLRALEPEDLELLYTIENDAGIWDVCDDPAPYSRFALKQYLAAQPTDIAQSGELRLVICTPDQDAIGLIDLVKYSRVDGRAEVCLALQSAFRGKGYGKAALLALGNYAYRYLHIRLLYAIIADGRNRTAEQTFAAAGYRPVAHLPQWHRVGTDYEDVRVWTLVLPI